MKVRMYRAILDEVSRYGNANPDLKRIVFKVVLYSDLIEGNLIPLGYDENEEMINVGGVRKLRVLTDILVTGPSGLGKSWLGARLREALTTRFIELDSIGFKDDKDHWVCDITKLTTLLLAQERVVVVGSCDNLNEVFTLMDPELLIIPIPPFTLFKHIQSLKAEEGALKGVPPQWVSGWLSASRMSMGEYIKWVAGKVGLYIYNHMLLRMMDTTSLHCEFAICFTPDSVELPIHAWHYEKY